MLNIILYNRWGTVIICRAYSAEWAEHEPEEYPGSRPASGEGVATAVIVKQMTTFKLHTTKNEKLLTCAISVFRYTCTCSYLNAGSVGEPFGVAHHAHVLGILLQFTVVSSTAVEARQALLFTFDPTTGVATRQGLVADDIRSLETLRVGTHAANGQQGRVGSGATETTRTLPTTYHHIIMKNSSS